MGGVGLRIIAIGCAVAGAAVLVIAVTGEEPNDGAAAAFVTGPVLLITGAILWWAAGLVGLAPKRPKVRDSLRTATATMQAFSQQAANNSRLRQVGRRTTAVVRSSRDAGAMVNLMPLIELELRVAVDGGAPVTVRHTEPVPHNALGMTAPGCTVVVYFDPAEPDRMTVAWDELPAADDTAR